MLMLKEYLRGFNALHDILEATEDLRERKVPSGYPVPSYQSHER